MSNIRCACYQVYLRSVFDGSEVPGCDLSTTNIEEGNWTRTLNQTSTAYLKFPLPDLFCCECAPQKWEHELVIERETEGGGFEEVWSGPVTRTVEDRIFGTFEIFASDRSVLWFEQPYAQERLVFPAGTDEGIVWATLIQMAEDCVQSGLLIRPTETGCPLTEDLVIEEGAEWTRALEELTSVHWAVVANQLLGPAENLQGTTVQHRLATDIDWEDSGAVIDDDGAQTATHVTVRNAAPTVPGAMKGTWPPGPPRPSAGVGCHTLEVIDPKLTTQAELTAAARMLYDQRKDGNRALVTSAGTLSRQTELCIDDLIPDRYVSVETNGTCNDFVEVKVIARVVANFNLSTEGGRTCLQETRVAIDMIPPGGEASSSRLSV